MEVTDEEASTEIARPVITDVRSAAAPAVISMPARAQWLSYPAAGVA
jgi:hypothetical protein